MLNCIRLYRRRCATTIKCDLCNSSCWTLGLWGDSGGKARWGWGGAEGRGVGGSGTASLCAEAQLTVAECFRVGNRVCAARRQGWQRPRWFLRRLMWSGSVGIPKPPPALRSAPVPASCCAFYCARHFFFFFESVNKLLLSNVFREMVNNRPLFSPSLPPSRSLCPFL